MSGVAVGAAVREAGAGIELDHEAIAPAVLLARARLDVPDQGGRGFRAQDAGAAREGGGAYAPSHARVHQQVLHPVRAQAVLGHEVVAPAAPGEPDLDPARPSGFPAPRREIEVLLLVPRRGRLHHPLYEATSSLDCMRFTPACCICAPTLRASRADQQTQKSVARPTK